MLVLLFFLLNIEFCMVQGVMFLELGLQVQLWVGCQRLEVRWKLDAFVLCGPLWWDSLVSLWIRAVWVMIMRVHMGWKVLNLMWWMRWKNLTSHLCLCWGLFQKWVGSSLNVTLFFCFGLGSWKEWTLSLLLRFFFFDLGGSWNDEPSWQLGFKWAQFLLYFFPRRPSMI